MNSRRFLIVCFLLTSVLAVSPLVFADTTYVAPEDRPTIVEISDTNIARLFRVEALLERTASAIVSAQHSLDQDSVRRMVLSALESLEDGGDTEDAVLPLLAEVDVNRDAAWLSTSQMDEIRMVQDEINGLLEAIVTALHRVLAEDVVDPRASDLQIALLLLSALCEWGDLETSASRTVTISELLELYPWHAAWVLEGESIQHAIDKVIDGGTIYIEPASFSEPLVIGKSVTLSWAQVLPNGGYGFSEFQNSPSISSARYRTTMTIVGEDIDVGLENISVIAGNTGILIGGSAHVSILDCCSEIRGSQVGIRIVDRASLIFEGGLRFCDVGILVQDQGTLQLRHASIGDNRVSLVAEGNAQANLQDASLWQNTDAGIEIHDAAQVNVQSSRISLNQGDGIRLYDLATLHISGSQIGQNGGYGIRVMSEETGADCSTVDTSLVTISGRANSIPDSDSPEGNRLGAYCPLSLAEMLSDNTSLDE